MTFPFENMFSESLDSCNKKKYIYLYKVTLPTINRMSSDEIKILNGFNDVFYITNILFA